jgi:hypothetical protein
MIDDDVNVNINVCQRAASRIKRTGRAAWSSLLLLLLLPLLLLLLED